MNIGLKIKELRTKNNLTLEELAARSELTKGFLSQLERDLTSPSIATLEDILEALGTNLSEFFKEEKNTRFVFGEDDYYINEKDGATTKFIVPNAQKNDMEPIILKLAPNAESSPIEPHEGEEFGFVLNGEIELINGGKIEKMNKGETFYLNGKHTHYLKNKGDRTAEILWIISPPNF
ncbi:transcriptional regulator with XRE-family HTH domain [Breznakia sp. PF5-3]|uniref:helix-turn-helix domain-containing protein n=1 Tax=unclassified Breznakia TaxID=2623764 RepID=UPI0024056672|nr:MULTISPECIES: XRE family transcriptional regulator [unclassified Breznakia]MDF9825822.1 transcriptional regulator with XRE-family HTH domain [Breznakia sp. PM6-1]MDF9836632.1 transcriptional regulator with XRE-family HTH domain [Breznakia sp. PF5-3]MDF9838800.1 transcriptional regulator with XRE-family HTH domain [Breznakia sp. PFB2-8]MDF9860831.1 transcriptional regulator with XRE-family HTH domain [Breznakia sp. PH5-24]